MSDFDTAQQENKVVALVIETSRRRERKKKKSDLCSAVIKLLFLYKGAWISFIHRIETHRLVTIYIFSNVTPLCWH